MDKCAMEKMPLGVPLQESPAIQTIALTKVFGTFVAVDHVSFSVQRGEIFGLLGPNGAGKTTTIRMLLALIKPTSGKALILGHDVARHVREVRQQMGYMSQRFSLYTDLTVEQNLDFFGGVYGLHGSDFKRRKKAILEMMGLFGREKDRVKDLSGGALQRLALGCAILHEPPVIFLDEPTAGVDPLARRTFWDLLYALSEQGKTILVTTHYMDEAEQCHRLAFIQRGRLVAIGTPEEIKRRMPGHVLEVLCDATDLALRLLRQSGAFLEVALYGDQLHVMVSDVNEGTRLIRELLKNHVQVFTIQPIMPSLEDVFIASVKELETEKDQ